MALTPLQFAKWAEVSADTVHKWLGGISLPKRDTMRFMIQKIKRERISVSLAWLCAGSGVLGRFNMLRRHVLIKKMMVLYRSRLSHLSLNPP